LFNFYTHFKARTFNGPGSIWFINFQLHLFSGCETESTAHDAAVLGVNIDGINEFTVTSGADSYVRFWKFKSRKLVNSIEMNAIISKSVIHRDRFVTPDVFKGFQTVDL
jgi:WD40 repeat protein